jgi:hypothetical protein
MEIKKWVQYDENSAEKYQKYQILLHRNKGAINV